MLAKCQVATSCSKIVLPKLAKQLVYNSLSFVLWSLTLFSPTCRGVEKISVILDEILKIIINANVFREFVILPLKNGIYLPRKYVFD